MKKLISIALSVLMLCTVLTACTTQNGGTEPTTAPVSQETQQPEVTTPAEPIEVVLWHTLTDHHQAALDGIIAGFNASQTQYTVVAEQQPYSEWAAKLLQAVSTGTGPDFATMFPSDAINYMNEGYLYDMTELVNDPETGIPDLKEQTAPGLYSEITQWGNESVYLMPVLYGSEVLFYNKTMFDNLGLSEPKTWTELEACAKAIYENYGIAGFGTDSITDSFQGWIRQAGSDYIDVANNTMSIDRDIAIEKLDWFANGVKEGYFRLVGEDYYFSNPFGSQAVGMYVGSAAGIDYVYSAIPEGEGSFEVAACPIPQEGPNKYISSWGTTYVCMSKDEAHAKGVLAFLKYMTEKDTLVGWATAFGSAPARKEAIEDPAYLAYAETNIAAKALIAEYDYIGFLPSVPGAATVRTEIDKMVQSVALGVSDAATAYDNFILACNAALNDN
ncbi:MAG TPA: extracellular solute-binding protein [Clostridia bacterium]|nr:extracellular solute-binding protein [Clostridia bacterium]